MTDEQINAAIAEACGWEVFCKPLGGCGFAAYAKNPNGDPSPGIPDFCTDLNAMHEAEKVLGNRLSAYGELLCEMTVVSERDFAECYIWHATARQRAEAFLRTLGKWEEVQG